MSKKSKQNIKTSAQRQKTYRQRRALEKVRNEYTVTQMINVCELIGLDVWPLLTKIAEEVFAVNGDGVAFVRQVVPMVYQMANTQFLLDKQASSAHRQDTTRG